MIAKPTGTLHTMPTRRNDPAALRLSEDNRRTYEALFRHPPAHDLEWGHVRALIEALCEVQRGRKGLFKATRRGVMATFHAPRERVPLSEDELVEVRSFVERSNEGVSTPVVAEGTRLLVAIDTEGARIFSIRMRGAEPKGLEAFHGNGYAAHLSSSGGGDARKPQPVSLGFYKDLGRALRGADQIVLVACGDGGAGAMQALRSELERQHPAIARQVVAARVLKRSRAREEHLLAEASSFYATFDKS